MNRTALWLSLLLLLGSSVSVSQTQAPSQTPSQTYVELILDASGSMWNTLADGRYRIVAAKDVLTQFVGSLPDDNLNVGLRIYGSQMSALDDGACDDTQLFVPLAGLDKSALTQAVQDANAQGATPIAKSLLAAADDFPAQAEKRLIVLVTDGEESCDGDLQAVAADLQARGLDIDIRIIGFDLTAEAAASFAGVGTFENAENAQQLASALESAVEEVVTEVPVVETACEAPASLTVAGAVEASYPFSINFEGPEGRISVHPVGGDDFSALGSAFTGSGNPVELTAPGEAGSYELRYTANNGNCVVTTRQLEVTAITATLTVPAQVEGGFEFAVTADGPAGRVAIFEPSDINYRNYDLYSFFVTSWNNTMLRAPSQVGSYDIRYYDQNGTLLTTTPLEVIAADVSLTTPEQIEAGYDFPIEFRGPEGRIAIFEPNDTNYRNYDDYSFYVTAWNDKVLTAPTEAGSYEVRYYDQNETLITSNMLEVIATTAGLSIPDSVEAGYAFSLDFS
ncbi:MAG: VWA domain-containing protein, partial [Deinococcota bacterium]